MFSWIVGVLVVAALVGAYLGGWSRGVLGLPRWPLRVGKDGIHRQPLVWFALLGALQLTACTDRRPSWTQPDTTAVADSDRDDGDHDRDHEQGKKHKHHEHEDAARP